LLCFLLAVGTTLAAKAPVHAGAVPLKDIDFRTSAGFNRSLGLVLLILAAFYTAWW